ncbi:MULTISPECIES: Gfo/Idh/MocA family oxidoreductase [Clostridia]|uniref:Gfo/Idh/MocA family protein n=1 Tax=Clostridia TaxID=186801 RepID=UPI000EA0B1C3|nr:MULTISPECIES: Gfo/Idh/MocA family oxidoreductase [Clostridia]NBJ68073.1 gfo/Idh/MocA family oxidoreductase [Roseburia sp. 1XD42-34]RKI82514.1 gfo/Idh/MocA family oxidoreductase [Clostridium sp. 1xD42-85]
MKICFIGLGSIGKMHLINLTKIMRQLQEDMEVHAFRNTNRRLDANVEQLIDKEIYLEENLHDDYDIAFITNPTFLHFHSIKLMATKANHLFIEKPIFEDCHYRIEELGLTENGVYHVAAPLRFTKVIEKLIELLAGEKIYSIRAICSSYLPEWRPRSDYRKSYSAKQSEGGGVALDLIHEWDYLTYLFGFPKEVYYLSGKYSHLDIDSDDLSVYLAVYPDKLLELHLDYFGKYKQRKIEVITKERRIVGDFLHHAITWSNGKKHVQIDGLKNDMYVAEMEYFLKNVWTNNTSGNNVDYAYEVLKLALGGEK